MVNCALRLVKETCATAGGDEHPVLLEKLVADAAFYGSDHAPESGFVGAEDGGCLAGGGVPGGCGHSPELVLPPAAAGGDDVGIGWDGHRGQLLDCGGVPPGGQAVLPGVLADGRW